MTSPHNCLRFVGGLPVVSRGVEGRNHFLSPHPPPSPLAWLSSCPGALRFIARGYHCPEARGHSPPHLWAFGPSPAAWNALLLLALLEAAQCALNPLTGLSVCLHTGVCSSLCTVLSPCLPSRLI